MLEFTIMTCIYRYNRRVLDIFAGGLVIGTSRGSPLTSTIVSIIHNGIVRAKTSRKNFNGDLFDDVVVYIIVIY